MRSMGHPDYVYRPWSEERRAAASANAKQRAADEQIEKHNEAARLMLRGLCNHFGTAVHRGMIEHWRTLGHQVVDLIADGMSDEHIPTQRPDA